MKRSILLFCALSSFFGGYTVYASTGTIGDPVVGPCSTNNNQCEFIGSMLSQDKFWYDDHGNSVYCDPKADIVWSGKHTVTLKNTGYNHDKEKSQNCYLSSGYSLPSYASGLKHGFYTAMVTLTLTGKSHNGGNNFFPGFWLNGNSGAWPANGELDIAERFNATSYTHLIGLPTNPPIPAGYNSDQRRQYTFDHQDTVISKQGRLQLDGKAHEYGLEWYFLDKNQVKITIWYDNKPIGSQIIYSKGNSNSELDSIFPALKDGHFYPIFDVADTGKHASETYTMKISNPEVYKVSGGDTPSTCEAPIQFNGVRNYNDKKGYTEFNWLAAPNSDVKNYTIYKYDGKTSLQTVQGNNFSDSSMGPGQTGNFKYYIKSNCANGASSPLSKPVWIYNATNTDPSYTYAPFN